MNILEIQQNDIDSKPGIYRIYAPKFDCSRLLGVDRSGLLYVGKSKNLRQRLKNLRTACELNRQVTPDKRGEIHVFGKALFNLIESTDNFLEMHPHLKPNGLYIQFEYTDDYSKKETELLREYLLKFGEVPPFNFKR